MKNLPKEIKKVYIESFSDPSVGLYADTAIIEANGDFLFDLDIFAEEDKKDALEEFRYKLEDAFGVLWDTPVKATFDFEENDEY